MVCTAGALITHCTISNNVNSRPYYVDTWYKDYQAAGLWMNGGGTLLNSTVCTNRTPSVVGGGVTVNETNGEVLTFVEKHHPPAPLTVYRSKDHGKTWAPMEVEIKPDANGHVPSMHMNEAGITLRHGKHAGRIIRAARHYAGRNHRSKWPEHYTTAIYSDDGGKTWQTSKPFAEMGTGEAAIAELSDGRLYYNSRAHWNKSKPPLRRRCASSADFA